MFYCHYHLPSALHLHLSQHSNYNLKCHQGLGRQGHDLNFERINRKRTQEVSLHQKQVAPQAGCWHTGNRSSSVLREAPVWIFISNSLRKSMTPCRSTGHFHGPDSACTPWLTDCLNLVTFRSNLLRKRRNGFDSKFKSCSITAYYLLGAWRKSLVQVKAETFD